jgi:hypothetical protein
VQDPPGRDPVLAGDHPVRQQAPPGCRRVVLPPFFFFRGTFRPSVYGLPPLLPFRPVPLGRSPAPLGLRQGVHPVVPSLVAASCVGGGALGLVLQGPIPLLAPLRPALGALDRPRTLWRPSLQRQPGGRPSRLLGCRCRPLRLAELGTASRRGRLPV